MSNINVENKYPKGPQEKESLLAASVTGYTRGLLVAYGADQYHAALPTVAGQTGVIGVIEEDQTVAVNATTPTVPISIISRGEAVAVVGIAGITAGMALTNDASGRVIPAGPGQPVVAVALDTNPNVGDFICVTMTPPSSRQLGDAVTHYVAAGAIPVATGSAGLGSGAAIAMTLAQPTAAQDGTNIFITAETSHAHTVTFAANGVNGNKHIFTFASQGDYAEIEAMATVWNVRGMGGGTTLT
jgi:hypothetical protein